MEKLFRAFKWLDFDQFASYLSHLTDTPIDTDALYQLVEDGALPVWCDMSVCATVLAEDFCTYVSLPPGRYQKISRYEHGVIYFQSPAGDELILTKADDLESSPVEHHVLRLRTADVETLAAMMNGTEEQPYTVELNQLRQQLENERAARAAAELRAEQAEAEPKTSHYLAIGGLLELVLDKDRPRYQQGTAAQAIADNGWRAASVSSLTKLFAEANSAVKDARKETQAKMEAVQAATANGHGRS